MSYFGRWGQCRYFIKCNESYEVLVPIYILIEVVRVEYQWFSVNCGLRLLQTVCVGGESVSVCACLFVYSCQ